MNRNVERPNSIMQIDYEDEDKAEVSMSPLIDCVFLLLIFFLVTSMLKRKEMLIPIQLPDQSAAVSETAEDLALAIGMDANGDAYRVADALGRDGELKYERIADLTEYLQSELDRQGREILSRPLRIDADRNTPFQKAIDVLDACKLMGFTDVGLKTRLRKK